MGTLKGGSSFAGAFALTLDDEHPAQEQSVFHRPFASINLKFYSILLTVTIISIFLPVLLILTVLIHTLPT